MSEAEKILEAARASLSEFCSEECMAFCCRRGYLAITSEQAKPLLKLVKDPADAKTVLERTSISLKKGCPALVDNKCSIYSERPQVCRDYPIFVKGKELRVSSYCTAVMDGKLYPYIAMLLKRGFVLVKKAEYSDLEFNIDLEKDKDLAQT